MEQKWIIVIVIAIFAFLSICYTVYREGKEGIIKKIEKFFGGRKVEHFEINQGSSVGLTDFNLEKIGDNLVTNSNFENGNNITQFVEAKGNNKIVTYPNPGLSSFVLRQILDGSSNQIYYKFRVKLTSNKTYQISFYCLDKNNVADNIVFLDTSNKNLKLKMLKKPIENSDWKIYFYNFYFSNEEDNFVDLLLGFNDKEKNKNLETSYITNVVLKEVLNQKFIPLVNNLRCYYNCFNKNSYIEKSVILKDLSGNGFDWNVSRPGALKNKSIILNGNTISGPNSYLLQNSNKINLDRKFCLFFDIKGLQLLPQFKKNEQEYIQENNPMIEGFNSQEEISPTTPPLNMDTSRHSLFLTIPGNENNSVELYIPKDYDNIILVCGGEIYTTSVKVINAANHIYCLNYNGNMISLLMDEQEILKTECPNLFFDNNNIQINKEKKYEGQLFSFAYYNMSLSIFEIQVVSSYLRKIRIVGVEGGESCNNESQNETSTSSSIPPIGANDLGMGSPTPSYQEEEEEMDNSKCPKMIYEKGHYYILIPQNSYLCKKLGYFGIKDYGRNIETARHIFETNFPNCPIPDILDPKKHKPKLRDCPFIIHQDNPCNYFECKDVDWKTNKINNESCKKRIDTYCSINWKYDPACFCWRPEQISNPQCQKWRGQFEPKDKCNFNKHDITDHPDSNQWIRKDKIPCWNCNLNAPEIGEQPCSEEL